MRRSSVFHRSRKSLDNNITQGRRTAAPEGRKMIKLHNIGTYPVYLKGSKKTIKRVIWFDSFSGKYAIKLHGLLWFVERGTNDWYTLEEI